jgi:hypothetical protein
MTTFTWTFPKVQRTVSLNGLSDVITNVHWRYRGTNGDGTTAEIYGVEAIGEPNPQDFTPWDQVTAADVEGWLEDIFGETIQGESQTQLEKMKATIQQKIDLLNNPTTITAPLVG